MQVVDANRGCATLAGVAELEPHSDLPVHGREISGVALAAPQRRAIASNHGDLTFAELDRQAEALAGYLQHAGLAEGDVLALLCTNRPEWIVAQQAALRSGLQMVPVNWHLKRDDIAYVIADSGAQALITEAIFVDELADAARDISNRIVIGEGAEGFTSFNAAVNQGLPTDPQRLRRTLMIYTSGSTGRPKGVRQASGSTDNGAAIGSQLTPRHLFIVDELPRTEAGKLYRYRLQEQFESSVGRSRHAIFSWHLTGA